MGVAVQLLSKIHLHIMPFKSKKQRAYLYANEPEIAKRWAKKYGNKIKKK